MDTRRFDHLTRLFSAQDTRRRVLGLLTVLPMLGGLLTLPEADDALAKRRHHHHVDQEKKKKKKKKKKACKPQSTATVCAGKCGTITNAQTCNKPVNCGPCDCVRTTCAAQGKTCGTISDECGGSLACGSCSNPTPICTDNVCVACSGDTECGDGMVCCGGSCAAGWTNQTTFGSSGSGLSQLHLPYRAAVSPDGLSAWVTDTDNHRISVWTRSSMSSIDWANQTTFGSFGSGLSQLNDPRGVAVSPDGLTAWVADTGNSRISSWTRSSTSSADWANQTTFGSEGDGPGQFAYPFGVAIATDGLIAQVADTYNGRISVWTRPDVSSTAWSNVTTFGSYGGDASQFNFPTGVAVSPDDLTVWVAEAGNHRISVWSRPDSVSTDWSNLTTFGSEGSGPSQFNNPDGVAVSADGRKVWVADTDNYRISIWTRPDANSTAWNNQTTFGSEGTGLSQFEAPNSVAVSPDGRSVWVADTYNNRISVWGQGCSA